MIEENKKVLSYLNFSNKQDFEDANKGFIATIPNLDIKDETVRSVWNLSDYAFLNKEEAPFMVNPSCFYTLRGTEVRDAKAWCKTLNRVLLIYGEMMYR